MEEGEEEMGEDEYLDMQQRQMQEEGSESGEQEENDDDEFQSDPEDKPNAGGDLESIDSDAELGDDIDTNIEGKRE